MPNYWNARLTKGHLTWKHPASLFLKDAASKKNVCKKLGLVEMKRRQVLWVIVLAQFFCTSLWFAGNAVVEGLTKDFSLSALAIGYLTSAVQFGFIAGTLVFALLAIADRFSPSRVFFWSALAGAFCNLLVVWAASGLESLLIFRFLTGFFLAGIYPVGMKIAADHYDRELGRSLGFLVGALVLGTAFPHLLSGLKVVPGWKAVFYATSLLAASGGVLLVVFVPNGPYRKQGKRLELLALFSVFRNASFRRAAFGYFGHMWELYTFWAFVPVVLQTYASFHETDHWNISLLSFTVIGIGSLACVAGGLLSLRIGSRNTAFRSLIISGFCCLSLPMLFHVSQPAIFLVFMLVWGATVISDSPMLSTLVARTADPQMKGSALTLVNSIGFSITIVSILVTGRLLVHFNSPHVYWLLAIGPVTGLASLRRLQDA